MVEQKSRSESHWLARDTFSFSQLLVEDVNNGLEYKFLTPVSASKHRRHGRKRHPGPQARWRLELRGECSVSCGGGRQAVVASCQGGADNR